AVWCLLGRLDAEAFVLVAEARARPSEDAGDRLQRLLEDGRSARSGADAAAWPGAPDQRPPRGLGLGFRGDDKLEDLGSDRVAGRLRPPRQRADAVGGQSGPGARSRGDAA